MTGQTRFTHLRTILAELYPDRTDLRRLLADAGINAVRVEIDSTAANNWHALLAEAEKTDKLAALLAVVQGEYGENPKLRKAIAAYRRTARISNDRQGEGVDPPAVLGGHFKWVAQRG